MSQSRLKCWISFVEGICFTQVLSFYTGLWKGYNLCQFSKPQYRYKKETDIPLKKYECEYYIVFAPKTSCFFCENCTDIFFDLDGPYGFLCEERKVLTDEGLDGTCNIFKEW